MVAFNSRYIACAESGNVIIWNRLTEQVIYKESQPGIVQLTFFDDGRKFFVISAPQMSSNETTGRVSGTCITRNIPSKKFKN